METILTSGETFLDDELTSYINEYFTKTTGEKLKRAIMLMDILEYNKYANDVYNYINLDTGNFDIDEMKLYFINLITGFLIDLIESLGVIIVDKDLINESYGEHLGLFVNILSSLNSIKNMSAIDAIYFSDIIANTDLGDEEKIYKIFSYYTQGMSDAEFYELVADFKPSFMEILTNKINALANTIDMEGLDTDDIDEVELLLKAEVIKFFGSEYKESFILKEMSITEDFNLLINNIKYINNNLNTNLMLLQEFNKDVKANLELSENIKTVLFDVYFIKTIQYVIDEKIDLNEAILNTYKFLLEYIHDTEMKGLKLLKEEIEHIKNLFLEAEQKDDLKLALDTLLTKIEIF